MKALNRTVLGVVLLAGLAACGSRQASLGDLTSDQLWEMGVAAYNNREWNDAIRYFDRYALVAGSNPLVVQARYYVAQSYFEQGQYLTAAAEYASLAGDLGRTDLADDARFMACRSYEELSPRPQLDQEYTRAAVDHCAALVDYFPDSEFAPRAREIVAQMRGKLAEKVYDTGRWYFRRRAYDSALVYFEDVVEQYPGSQWAPRALLKQYEIYGILEYEQERQEVRRRLVEDYPDSREARQVQEGSAAVG